MILNSDCITPTVQFNVSLYSSFVFCPFLATFLFSFCSQSLSQSLSVRRFSSLLSAFQFVRSLRSFVRSLRSFVRAFVRSFVRSLAVSGATTTTTTTTTAATSALQCTVTSVRPPFVRLSVTQSLNQPPKCVCVYVRATTALRVLPPLSPFPSVYPVMLLRCSSALNRVACGAVGWVRGCLGVGWLGPRVPTCEPTPRGQFVRTHARSVRCVALCCAALRCAASRVAGRPAH